MAKPMFDISPPAGDEEKDEKKKTPAPREEPEGKILKIEKVEPAPRPKVSISSGDEFLATLSAKPAKYKPPKPSSGAAKPSKRFSFGASRSRFLIFIILLAGVIGGVYALGFSISRAEVRLTTVKNFKPFEFQLNFKKSPTPSELSRGILPLEVIEKTATSTKEYQASGQGEVLAKARGRILIFNAFSASPQILVEKTRFLSPAGKLFRLTRRITVPGAKVLAGNKIEPVSIEAEVLADEPGPEYNINPTRFSIPGFKGTERYEKFYGVSKETFEGGARGTSTIILQADISSAQEGLARSVLEGIEQEIKKSLPENIKLISGATQTQIKNISTSAKAGDAGAKFKASATIQVKALIFDDFLVRDTVRKQFAPENDGGLAIPTFDISYNLVEASFDKKELTILVKGSENVRASIDAVGLKRSLMGKDEEGVKKQILSLAGVEEAKVSFWPFWVRRMPRNLDRINIQIN